MKNQTGAIDVLGLIKSKIDSQAFDVWFNIDFAWNDNTFTFFATSRFNQDFITNTFGAIFQEIETEFGIKILVAVSRPELRVVTNDIVKPKISLSAFDKFIESDANNFAVTAVKKLAAGSTAFSPLVIYGPTGSGKTMMTEILRGSVSSRVVSITGSEFVSNFVRAMNDNAVFQFKDALRKCDIFIMDDIQGLAGKRASAAEFAALLDDLIRMNKTVVLTSNIAPSQITGFDKRIVSLMSSGLAVDLSAPDASVRCEFLRRAGVSAELADLISKRAPANGHIMAGIVKKITAWMELEIGELSEQILEKLLCDVLEKQATPVMRVKNMCAKLGIAFDDVMSATRTKPVVLARQKIMVALKQSTNMTLAEIGRVVGDRDHASVLYAISCIERAKQTDMLLESEIADLIK